MQDKQNKQNPGQTEGLLPPKTTEAYVLELG